MFKRSFIFLSLIFISGCTTVLKVHYELPPDWKDETTREQTIEKYLEYLLGKKIYLDPGHGGNDRKNKSRDELVVEADLNLKVALYLKNYLEASGAVVYLSRASDVTVDLKERSANANKTDADVFISIHHNATGDEKDAWTNYTSTYYHAKETDFEYEPCNRDLARYIQRDLSYVMDNPGGLGSFDGTYSDYIIYPKAGFSVLRLSEKPAVLAECSFFTSSYEKQRLSIDEFNRIEAWGIFRGLAKYFKSGIPQIIPMFNDSLTYCSDSTNLVYQLKDKSGINQNSVIVYIDSTKTNSNFNGDLNTLTIPLQGVEEGEHRIRIICENNSGNHSFPFRKKIIKSN